MSPAEFQTWYDQQVAERRDAPPPPPSGEPAAPAPPPGGGTVLDVVAKNIAFDQTTLTAPADRPFTIHFDNQDAGTPHDVDILDASGKKVVDNKDFPGVGDQGLPGTRRCRRGPTSSSARSTRRRCSARSRSSKGAPMATTTLTPAASAYRSGLYEWVTTTDHKKIGILYIVNSFIFFFLGGLLALGVRTELARPGLQLVHDERSTTSSSRCTGR